MTSSSLLLSLSVALGVRVGGVGVFEEDAEGARVVLGLVETRDAALVAVGVGIFQDVQRVRVVHDLPNGVVHVVRVVVQGQIVPKGPLVLQRRGDAVHGVHGQLQGRGRLHHLPDPVPAGQHGAVPLGARKLQEGGVRLDKVNVPDVPVEARGVALLLVPLEAPVLPVHVRLAQDRLDQRVVARKGPRHDVPVHAEVVEDRGGEVEALQQLGIAARAGALPCLAVAPARLADEGRAPVGVHLVDRLPRHVLAVHQDHHQRRGDGPAQRVAREDQPGGRAVPRHVLLHHRQQLRQELLRGLVDPRVDLHVQRAALEIHRLKAQVGDPVVHRVRPLERKVAHGLGGVVHHQPLAGVVVRHLAAAPEHVRLELGLLLLLRLEPGHRRAGAHHQVHGQVQALGVPAHQRRQALGRLQRHLHRPLLLLLPSVLLILILTLILVLPLTLLGRGVFTFLRLSLGLRLFLSQFCDWREALGVGVGVGVGHGAEDLLQVELLVQLLLEFFEDRLARREGHGHPVAALEHVHLVKLGLGDLLQVLLRAAAHHQPVAARHVLVRQLLRVVGLLRHGRHLAEVAQQRRVLRNVLEKVLHAHRRGLGLGGGRGGGLGAAVGAAIAARGGVPLALAFLPPPLLLLLLALVVVDGDERVKVRLVDGRRKGVAALVQGRRGVHMVELALHERALHLPRQQRGRGGDGRRGALRRGLLRARKEPARRRQRRLRRRGHGPGHRSRHRPARPGPLAPALLLRHRGAGGQGRGILAPAPHPPGAPRGALGRQRGALPRAARLGLRARAQVPAARLAVPVQGLPAAAAALAEAAPLRGRKRRRGPAGPRPGGRPKARAARHQVQRLQGLASPDAPPPPRRQARQGLAAPSRGLRRLAANDRRPAAGAGDRPVHGPSLLRPQVPGRPGRRGGRRGLNLKGPADLARPRRAHSSEPLPPECVARAL
mmetsp:Transcript_6507/g.16782  ORF Transcript_6507/g.16782 Transcript_6507/m.16782 type:complete len:943 (+) Transcript_6507:203-3031(+)